MAPVRTGIVPYLLWLPCVLALAGCGGGTGAFIDDDGGGGDDLPPQDVRLNTDPAGNELSFAPQMCCDGTNVYVVWADRRDGLLDVYFNRSVDRGVSWLPQDVRLDTDAPGAGNSQTPQICCDGSRVYVVWADDRNGFSDIYGNRSLDGGDTWLSADVRLDRGLPGTADSREPAIACDGASVVVAWADRRNGSWDVYANRSSDGGATWAASDVRVDADPGSAQSTEPQVVRGSGVVAVAWRDDRHGGLSLLAARSLNGGASWTSEARVDRGPQAVGAFRIRAAGDAVLAVWSDARNGASDIYFNRSVDAGATWSATDERLDTDLAGAAASVLPDMCVADADVYVSWQDARNGNEDVLFNRSRDGGASWLSDDIRLVTNAPGASRSLTPRLCCDGASVAVTWSDDRNGRTDVYLSWSPDAGSRWLSVDLRVDDDEPGAGHSIAPAPCCVGDRVVVVWSDQRHGPGDLYARGADFGGR